MSAAPISAPDDALPAFVADALARAGWPEAAWRWEQAMLAALAALAGEDPEAARSGLAEADRLAMALPADDLRRLTAAAGIAAMDADGPALAALAARWQEGEAWLATLRPHARARSSTFHLRLERKHPNGYRPLFQQQVRRLWQDGLARLAAGAATGTSATDALERWKQAAANLGFVDARKITAAAALLLG